MPAILQIDTPVYSTIKVPIIIGENTRFWSVNKTAFHQRKEEIIFQNFAKIRIVTLSTDMFLLNRNQQFGWQVRCILVCYIIICDLRKC